MAGQNDGERSTTAPYDLDEALQRNQRLDMQIVSVINEQSDGLLPLFDQISQRPIALLGLNGNLEVFLGGCDRLLMFYIDAGRANPY
jgi:hypothetical protein